MWTAILKLFQHISHVRALTTVTRAPKLVSITSDHFPKPLHVNPTWLRDHCRCDNCFDHGTGNKLVNIVSKGLHIEPIDTAVKGELLHVSWPDGHTSTFSLQWLWDNTPQDKGTDPLPQVPWQGQDQLHASEVEYQDLLSSDEARTKLFYSIRSCGIGLVRKVPRDTVSRDALATMAAKIFPAIRLGPYGKFFRGHPSKLLHDQWEITSPMTIYPHTDQSYISEPPGLKMLHGDSQLKFIDGFALFQKLKFKNEESFKALSEIPVTFEYNSRTQRYNTIDTVLKLHPVTGDFWRIRFSPYHRGTVPLGLGREKIERFDKGIHQLVSILENDIVPVTRVVTADTLVLTDNWRVLVGMTTVPTSILSLCFIGHSDFMSMARTLGVVPAPASL